MKSPRTAQEKPREVIAHESVAAIANQLQAALLEAQTQLTSERAGLQAIEEELAEALVADVPGDVQRLQRQAVETRERITLLELKDVALRRRASKQHERLRETSGPAQHVQAAAALGHMLVALNRLASVVAESGEHLDGALREVADPTGERSLHWRPTFELLHRQFQEIATRWRVRGFEIPEE